VLLNQPTISVVICAFDLSRWGDLVAGVEAACRMLADGDELIVVIDHNRLLLEEAQRRLCARVVPSCGPQGLSGARNTGVGISTSDVVVFLDDDALPQTGWLQAYRVRFADPRVALVGGAIDAQWECGRPPVWFPTEFGWVVGCDYRGLPAHGEAIRNPIGANMGIRRAVFERVGGFSLSVGRVGSKPTGNEETELAIRVRQADPAAQIVRDADTRVLHRVPASRSSLTYFLRRCYYEGRSKSALSRSVGARDALSSEREHVRRNLSSGVMTNLASALKGDLSGLARATLIVVGLGVTVIGYLLGWKRSLRGAGQPPVPISGPRT
jgi:glycosyltransferase involved in cell wall biosynthesis